MCMFGCGGKNNSPTRSGSNNYTPKTRMGAANGVRGSYSPSAKNPFTGHGGFGTPKVRTNFSGGKKR